MELGSFIRAVHFGNGHIIEGELVAYDDDGFLFILNCDKEYYINYKHYYLKKLCSLEVELI
jgi:hypothetical protein